MKIPAVSIWEHETFFSPQDVIIAGGGVVGLWSSLELITAKPNLRITILERGTVPVGASTRNAGFACFGSPTELLGDVKRMKEDEMWEIVEMRFKGIEKIRKHFTDDAIDFDNCGGYECFSREKHDLHQLRNEVEWLNHGMKKITGADETFTWCNDKLDEFGFNGFDAMIQNKMEGGLHSGKLVQLLSRKVQSLGVNIMAGVQVNGWEKTYDGIEVNTPGFSLRTEQFIICNNSLAAKLIAELKIEPARGQVLVTAPIDYLKMKGTFHYDEGYYYFRNLGNRLLIGGARNKAFEQERTNELVLNELIQSELERFISEHLLPHRAFNITHRWSGIMGFTENKKPFVQEVEENVYAVIACNGMGVALSPVIAEKVAALVVNW